VFKRRFAETKLAHSTFQADTVEEARKEDTVYTNETPIGVEESATDILSRLGIIEIAKELLASCCDSTTPGEYNLENPAGDSSTEAMDLTVHVHGEKA